MRVKLFNEYWSFKIYYLIMKHHYEKEDKIDRLYKLIQQIKGTTSILHFL